MPSSTLTYSLAEAVERLGVPSERWLAIRLRDGRLPGRKFGKAWRLTDQDIADALEVCSNGFKAPATVEPPKHPSGLTPTSRRRLGL